MQTTRFHDFIQCVDERKLNVFGIELYENGKLAERYRWKEDVPVQIWSHTKCFTSAAVGIAIEEGRLSLSDRVVDLLPECVPEQADPMLYKVTLRHVLMMSSGQKSKLLFGPLRHDTEFQLRQLSGDGKSRSRDLMELVLAEPFQEEPGTSFEYSNSDADIVSCCVEKAVGMTLQNYLYYRLMKPLDIPYPAWQSDLRGHSYGDGGLYLKTSDMVKLGLLYANDGVWNGQRILSSQWIRESTKKQIDTPVRDPWDCGYGYLIWKFPMDDGYRFAGIGGQNSIILPSKGIVIGINADVGERLGELKEVLTETLIDRF